MNDKQSEILEVLQEQLRTNSVLRHQIHITGAADRIDGEPTLAFSTEDGDSVFIKVDVE
jgi:hypothetical protein